MQAFSRSGGGLGRLVSLVAERDLMAHRDLEELVVGKAVRLVGDRVPMVVLAPPHQRAHPVAPVAPA